MSIKSLELVEWYERDPARPIAVLDVTCSAGTYVRAIARDLGERLGTGAYLGALTRSASGPFTIEGAHSLDTIRERAAAQGPDGIRELLLPPDAGLDDIPTVALTPTEIADAGQGRFVRPQAGLRGTSDGIPLRLVDARGRDRRHGSPRRSADRADQDPQPLTWRAPTLTPGRR